jgi:hypothetical protein
MKRAEALDKPNGSCLIFRWHVNGINSISDR